MNYYSYLELKNAFCEKFPQYLPEPFRSGKVKNTTVKKTNRSRDAICICSKDIQGSPILYMDDIYKKYMETGDLYVTLDFFAGYYMEAVKYMKRNMEKFEKINAPEKIIFQLVNYDRNRELLNTVPHRRFQNLALIYRMIIISDEENLHSALITSDYLNATDYSEEDLYALACENTKNIFPPRIKRIDENFFALSNEYLTYGATAMMYPEVIKSISDMLKSDLYILPSSIHELFIMAKGEESIEEILEVIRDANENLCAPEEVLSDRPYCYHRKEDVIDML